MGYATAKPLDPDLIPVIDVTPLRDGSAPLSVAQKLHQASQQLGFIYITGHGILDGVIDRLRTTAMDFFTADPTIKETVRVLIAIAAGSAAAVQKWMMMPSLTARRAFSGDTRTPMA